MPTRILTAIALCAVLAASASTAHAGFLKNTANLTKQVVKVEKDILTLPLSAKERAHRQVFLAKGATKCLVKAATKNPCE
jgi:hypothetical protein